MNGFNIDSHLAAPMPKRLWHYTNVDAFLSILQSGNLWASDVRYMNDFSEIENAFEHLAMMGLESDTPPIGGLLTSTAKALKNLMVSKYRIHVLSFSLNCDQLSQWRGYVPSGKGVSLGFEFTEDFRGNERLRMEAFAECVYRQTEKSDLINSAIGADFRRDFESLLAGGIPTDSPKIEEATIQFVTSTFKILTLFKHQAFEEEREWRWVMPIDPAIGVKSILNFRAGRAGLIPYIPFPMPPLQLRPALKEVIVGFSPDPELELDAVRFALARYGYDGVEVRHSDIPYRTW